MTKCHICQRPAHYTVYDGEETKECCKACLDKSRETSRPYQVRVVWRNNAS